MYREQVTENRATGRLKLRRVAAEIVVLPRLGEGVVDDRVSDGVGEGHSGFPLQKSASLVDEGQNLIAGEGQIHAGDI